VQRRNHRRPVVLTQFLDGRQFSRNSVLEAGTKQQAPESNKSNMFVAKVNLAAAEVALSAPAILVDSSPRNHRSCLLSRPRFASRVLGRCPSRKGRKHHAR
jgi:hypothetical protein